MDAHESVPTETATHGSATRESALLEQEQDRAEYT